jgi:hypothetical protein
LRLRTSEIAVIRQFLDSVERKMQADTRELKRADGLAVHIAWVEMLETELRALEANARAGEDKLWGRQGET